MSRFVGIKVGFAPTVIIKNHGCQPDAQWRLNFTAILCEKLAR
jgi:hypothetical protein